MFKNLCQKGKNFLTKKNNFQSGIESIFVIKSIKDCGTSLSFYMSLAGIT